MDLTFRLEEGSILLLEEEKKFTICDLVRFAYYVLRFYDWYQTTIHTVVLTPSFGSPGTKVLDTG